jgi:phage terminase large subunit-like protein
LNVSFFLGDEVHAWPPAEARKLFKVVTDSMVKRSNPLTVIISTAGEGQGGLPWDLWDYSHKAASGEIDDPTFAPIIFAAPPEADWRDEAAWHEANPAIDAGFCSLEELRIKARRIEHFPAGVADFKRFHLNQWIEGAAALWIDLSLYDKAEPMTDPDALLGQPCYVGVDLSSVEDLTAVLAVFPDGAGENRSFDILATFFLPAAGLARKAERDRADYLRWKKDRYLRVTEGNRVDQAAIMAHVLELARLYDVREVAIDRWNSTAVTTALQAEGITVAEFGQGFASMAAPVKELKRSILGGQFRHGGNPVLRMCFGNVVATRDDAENEKFTKERSRGRIDGAVAAAMGVGRALANESGPSIYETGRPDGFVFL